MQLYYFIGRRKFRKYNMAGILSWMLIVLLYKQVSLTPSKEANVSIPDLSENGTKAVIEFKSSSSFELENERTVRLGVRRYGRLNLPVCVMVYTINGTALAGIDYIHMKSKIHFAENETLRMIYIGIVDDNIWGPDKFFFAMLFINLDNRTCQHTTLGSTSLNTIRIINDEEPGEDSSWP